MIPPILKPGVVGHLAPVYMPIGYPMLRQVGEWDGSMVRTAHKRARKAMLSMAKQPRLATPRLEKTKCFVGYFSGL